MASLASGTITSTGAITPIVGSKVSIKMKFSGTASVDVETQMPSGNWIKIDTGITADYYKIFDGISLSAIRLNCTAYTNSVEYELDA